MIQFVCFSRARPLQLDGYLNSLFAQCGSEDVAVIVLARVDEEYRAAYERVEADHPTVKIVRETDFAEDLDFILQGVTAEYLSFGCDDVVFVAPLSPSSVAETLGNWPNVLGVTLRLGKNIQRGMFGAPMSQPDFIVSKWLTWDFTTPTSHGDWAYPWEVLGTVYRTDFVRRMVSTMNPPHNPSELEDNGSRLWQALVGAQTMMMCAYTSRIVVPTVNLVQETFRGNGIVGNSALSAELLLHCYEAGMRLDIEQFSGFSADSWRVADFHLWRAAT